MKRYYRSANDPKRFKPLVTTHDGSLYRYWVVSTRDFSGILRVASMYAFTEAIEQANEWADEYRAAWVAANMKAA